MGVRAAPGSQEPDHPDRAVVGLNRRTRSLFDLWSVDLKTGGLTLLHQNPGDQGGWVIDKDLKVRGAMVLKPEGGGELRLRDNDDAPWRTVASWTVDDEFSTVQLSKDGKTLYVQTNLGADTRGLYAMDFATGKMTLVASDPGADVDDVLVNPVTKAIEAVSFNRLRASWKALDKSIEKDFAALAKVAPGDFEVESRDKADQNWIVVFNNDASAVRYYQWDRAAQKATLLFTTRPALEKYTLATMKPVEIKSRDGLMLPCYLTLPVGVPSKNLPLVLYVHGGPWARDAWGYQGNSQWLANRGYAVLQVNYRGSTGFGKKFKNAAKREFAGKMHDDLIDAVNWAVKEGYADKKKVAIMGGSYGGYATLVGLSFTPEVFACGVDIVGPSSLATLIESFPPYWKPFLAQNWYPFVGNPADPKDREDMLKRSPITKVDQIKAPLLIGQGANDPRVTKKESDNIVEALKKRGVAVEYIVFPDEGHGFQRPENRLKFWTASEAFFAKHLGGRAEPAKEPASMVPAGTPSGGGMN
jgi:dipeptidyl aminopeptidase/acylaminoacyl peptidase